MADFIHAREFLHAGDVVVVDCSHQCNVCIMDDGNFNSFKSRRQHKYYGGHATHFPTKIDVPYDGWWNTTIDLGGGSANIKYNISYIKNP